MMMSESHSSAALSSEGQFGFIGLDLQLAVFKQMVEKAFTQFEHQVHHVTVQNSSKILEITDRLHQKENEVDLLKKQVEELNKTGSAMICTKCRLSICNSTKTGSKPSATQTSAEANVTSHTLPPIEIIDIPNVLQSSPPPTHTAVGQVQNDHAVGTERPADPQNATTQFSISMLNDPTEREGNSVAANSEDGSSILPTDVSVNGQVFPERDFSHTSLGSDLPDTQSISIGVSERLPLSEDTETGGFLQHPVRRKGRKRMNPELVQSSITDATADVFTSTGGSTHIQHMTAKNESMKELDVEAAYIPFESMVKKILYSKGKVALARFVRMTYNYPRRPTLDAIEEAMVRLQSEGLGTVVMKRTCGFLKPPTLTPEQCQKYDIDLNVYMERYCTENHLFSDNQRASFDEAYTAHYPGISYMT